MTRDPADLKLSEIIAPFRPQEEIGRCVLGRLECSDADPCGAHDRWKLVRRLIEEFFEGTTIADVIAGRSAKWSNPEARRSDRESPQPDGTGTAKG
jgi:DNA-binding IscR family transcriptional regulator